MLVLSRMRDESVVLFMDGKQVARVQIVDVRGEKVRLGFEADKSVAIHRQEVAEAIAGIKAQ